MRVAIPCLALSACLLLAPAHAKLPPLNDEAKGKAEEAKAKTAWSDKSGAYQLCKAMDRVAAHYRQDAKAAGKEAPAPVDTPACTDPGPFVATGTTGTAAPPLESAGAHSPAATATAPPSSKATAAEIQGKSKK